MAKRTTRSQSKQASSSTQTNGEMGLGVNSPEEMKKTVPKKQSRAKSAKKHKTPAYVSKAARIDALKPKKPPTAFFFFLEDFRKEFQEQNPNVKSMRDIGKACGEKWKTMSYEEKVHYYDIATEKRAEFDRAMADFTRRKENGEFEEFEDDSDFDE